MRATTRNDCIYRCSCGVVYSNAADESKRVMIVERPEVNVPEQVRDGLDDALARAVNKHNRRNKREKFCYETSEDAVTWTIFRGLQQLGRTEAVLDTPVPGKPRVLLWGVPVDAGPSQLAADALAHVSTSLHEEPDHRTEPDVALVWDDLAVLVEAKYRSSNDHQQDPLNVGRYLDRPELFIVPPETVREAGYYELTRNWRVGIELAERLDVGTFLLVNLGPPQLATSAGKFEATLSQDESRRFVHRTWCDLLAAAAPLQDWLSDFAHSRGLCER